MKFYPQKHKIAYAINRKIQKNKELGCKIHGISIPEMYLAYYPFVKMTEKNISVIILGLKNSNYLEEYKKGYYRPTREWKEMNRTHRYSNRGVCND